MKKNVLLLGLGLLCLLLGSCSEKEQPPTYVFPLQVGNYWEMINTVKCFNEDNESTYIDTMYIWIDMAMTSPSDEDCYRLKYRYSTTDPDCFYYEYVVNRPDGFYLLGWSNKGVLPPFKGMKAKWNPGLFRRFVKDVESKETVWLDEPRMIMPKSCKVGTEWSYPESSHYLPITYTIEAKINISTGCGNMNCHTRKSVVDFDIDWEYYDYFCSKGLAKFYYEEVEELTDEHGNHIDNQTLTWELLLKKCELN